MSKIKSIIDRDVIMERRERREQIRHNYIDSHRACPECGSIHTRQTYRGFVLNLNNPETYKDENKVTCSNCGWKGIVHDLVT